MKIPKKITCSGITLIELMIVMMVLAVLIAVLLPSLRSYQHDANIRKAMVDLHSLKAGLESYYEKMGGYSSIVDAGFFTNQNVVKTILADPFKTNTSTTPATYRSIIFRSLYGDDDGYFIYSCGGLPFSATGTAPAGNGALWEHHRGTHDEHGHHTDPGTALEQSLGGDWQTIFFRPDERFLPLEFYPGSISAPFPYVTNLE